MRSDYVEKPNDAKLVDGAINGMLSALDPHSGYLNPKQFRELQIQTTGEFAGIGLEVTMEDSAVKVVSPIEDTPAAKAGIQSGDVITAIDKDDIQGLTLEDAVDKMRGSAHTPITLTIVRKGIAEPFDIKIVRDVIHVDPVKYEADDDVGYIRRPPSMNRHLPPCNRPSRISTRRSVDSTSMPGISPNAWSQIERRFGWLMQRAVC